MSTDTLLGIGLYSLPEAARLLRVPTANLRHWVGGYDFKSRKGEWRTSPPVLYRQLCEVEGETILTFQDLIELHFITLFHEEGVSWPTIRAAAKRAARLFQTDHPFAVRKLHTDGKSIFAAMSPDDVEFLPQERAVTQERVIEDLALGQIVIGVLAEPFFHKLDYEADEVRRWWPLGRERRIVLDAEHTFGKPIDRASGVPTHVLYRMARSGESLERVADWYSVDVQAVSDAIEFETEWYRKAA